MKNLDYKGSRISGPHRDSMADELAAMANTASGIFVLGVDDKSGPIVGIPEDKLGAVETWMRDICNDLITPPLLYRIRKIPVIAGEGVELIIVRIDVP